MAGERPQEIGQGHGYDHTALEKGEEVQLKEPDKSGKRQPRLTPGRENGNGGRRIFNIDDQSFSPRRMRRQGTISIFLSEGDQDRVRRDPFFTGGDDAPRLAGCPIIRLPRYDKIGGEERR